jgi:preprotein translocase subunit YajC
MSQPTALIPVQEPENTTEGGPSPLAGLTPWLLIGLVIYIVLIAPERKNRKKREAMLQGLKKGDKVITTSGMYGSVAQVKEDVVTVQVADGVRLRFSRQAIQAVLEEEERAE